MHVRICIWIHLVTYRTHRANDIESDAITSPVITFSLSCKIRQMVTLALYKVALVTLINKTEQKRQCLHPPLSDINYIISKGWKVKKTIHFGGGGDEEIIVAHIELFKGQVQHQKENDQ